MPLAIIEQLFSTPAPIQLDDSVFGLSFGIISVAMYLCRNHVALIIKRILKVNLFN